MCNFFFALKIRWLQLHKNERIDNCSKEIITSTYILIIKPSTTSFSTVFFLMSNSQIFAPFIILIFHILEQTTKRSHATHQSA
ncbi:hypothetical protein PUN28_006762 [Cardiocondyla obscurior]|uniref:Uncharacterized protein n=1 Tax=Cardiocondyla obscurior TaxID=286306 RepID=A0AAW2G4V7_9HYME